MVAESFLYQEWLTQNLLLRAAVPQGVAPRGDRGCLQNRLKYDVVDKGLPTSHEGLVSAIQYNLASMSKDLCQLVHSSSALTRFAAGSSETPLAAEQVLATVEAATVAATTPPS